jgi:hypothetical protein
MVNCQTSIALNRAIRLYRGYQSYTTNDRLLLDLRSFIDQEIIQVSSFGAAAAENDLHAFVKVNSLKDLQHEIIWPSWRLALEYRMLYFRINASTNHMRIKSYVSISDYLQLSYGLWLIGQKDNAIKAAQVCASVFPSVIDRVLRPDYPADVLGSVGYFFNLLGIEIPSHKVFEYDANLLLTQRGLESATNARVWYSNPSYQGGAILQGPTGDLIPLELILVNQHLSNDAQDTDITSMKQYMTATEYPDDPLFIELDTELTAAGF